MSGRNQRKGNRGNYDIGPSSTKAEERQIRAAHRRNRKDRRHREKEEEDMGDFVSLRNQLEVLGLTLREIPGDG